MGICLTVIPITVSTLTIPHKQRNSNIEALYSILKGKAEPTTEELETVILSDKAYAMGFLKC
ncbi:hypothetical protein U3516DRAFT_759752 [Neocallimastix sp. 'constans']